eukprot:455392_1
MHRDKIDAKTTDVYDIEIQNELNFQGNDNEENMDDTIRESWKVDSKCEVYSVSKCKWYSAKIVNIFTDDEGEWLQVKYGSSTKQIQRKNKQIRPHVKTMLTLSPRGKNDKSLRRSSTPTLNQNKSHNKQLAPIKPLQQFKCVDISSKIIEWIDNDINYKNNL